jgi:serine/threonine protein kinase
MADQIPMPDKARKHLETNMLGQKISGMTIFEVLGSGNTAVTYEVHDENGVPWALKLVSRESYGKAAPLREVGRFSEAEDERFLVFPKEIGDWTLKLKGKDEKFSFIWFKSRRVNGQTLLKFLEDNENFSAKTEVFRFIENICVALDELGRIGYCHGDLHDRNIMREVIGEKGPIPEIHYVIIDFSDAHPVGEMDEGLSKDLESFGKHLRAFSDVIFRREELIREDEVIIDAISHIPGLLNGTAPESMGISTATHILDRFKKGIRVKGEAPRKLTDPFHPLNSEDIGNDALLADLCFTKMWWLSELEHNSNVLLIGPRGCGKTMVFRRLRLKTKIKAKKSKEIQKDLYAGFYIPCETIFFMRFSDLSNIDIDAYKDALVIFFNLAILSEVASTLSILPNYMHPISKTLPSSLSSLIREYVSDMWNELRLPVKVTTLDEITSCSENLMRHIRKCIAYGEQLCCLSSSDFISRLVELIKNEVPSLSAKYFTFFIDDYTEERVPLSLQDALHPIVCHRSPGHCFKISAHMFGSIYNYPRPLSLDEGRNIEIINLGTAYLNRNKRKAEGKLLLRILNDRFKHCDGYNGTIEDWLGKTSYPGGRTLSRALHDTSLRSKVYYHGVNCLMDLCTGDYSEMIRMVGTIFHEARIDAKSSVRMIPPAIQSRAIEKISRQYLSLVRHIRPDGQKLYEIVLHYGNLSKRILYEHPLVGQGKASGGQARKDPYDLLNIYVDDFTQASKYARKTWERLQKASILVDIGIAPSIRRVISDRATLRRIYSPAFRTTLSSSERLQLTKKQFEWFMDKPDEFCTNYFGQKVSKQTRITFLSENEEIADKPDGDDLFYFEKLPQKKDRISFCGRAPKAWEKLVRILPEPVALDNAVEHNSHFDLYIGAFGFEERTTDAVCGLAELGVRVENAIMLEFDRFYETAEMRRPKYEEAIQDITSGKAYRPFNAPITVQDVGFPRRMKQLLNSLGGKSRAPSVLFDCTSCPSLILSTTLKVLFDYQCTLTLLYSEAEEYYPTFDEWKSGTFKPGRERVQGPFEGVRFIAKPPVLQCDDTGELPILLVLFPTFNTERTDGVLASIDPTARIWIFGEPHDLSKNSYRIEMAQKFASPIMHPGDPWSLLSTFDYRKTILELAGIYKDYRFRNRILLMSHGSKMQTLGVNLYAAVHQISQVFAMPKKYDPKRYSKGCVKVWGIHFDSTHDILKAIKNARATIR